MTLFELSATLHYHETIKQRGVFFMENHDVNILSLDKLKLGIKARVIKIDSTSREAKRRLLDMGVTPGVIVEVKRVAPMGDPVDIHVRDYDLSIRKSDLMHITVKPL